MNFRLPALILLSFVLAHPARAETDSDLRQASQEYRHCLDLAKSRPDDGLEEALAWHSLGGGEPAMHCAALARIGQHQYADGARRLEALARESKQPGNMRAGMLAQAAQAWILADDYDHADADQRQALTLAPDQADLLVDHALTLGMVHHYKDAAAELDKVITRHPDRIDAVVMRASAKRYLDDLKGAMDDVEWALLRDPDFPDALVERGTLRRLNGDDKGARADWLRVLGLSSTGQAAETARRNLELLDIKEPAASAPQGSH